MKKFISLLLALLMVVSLVTVATVAVGAEPADTNLYFEIPSTWNADAYYFCHIWEVGGPALNTWNGANGLCTKVDGQDGFVSYDINNLTGDIEDGKTYGMIFYNNASQQTYNTYFNRDCLGDTLYVDLEQKYVNPEDSSKSCDAAFFRNSTFGGPARTVTNTGVVQGICLPVGQTDVDVFADFMKKDGDKNSKYENALEYSDYKDCQSLIEYVFSQLEGVTYDDLAEYLPEEFVVPSAPATPDEPEKPEGTYRYYFAMPDEWYNDMATGAGIYWWEGSDLPGAWPGKSIPESSIDGVYYCDVPDDVATIIWNNAVDGGSDDTAPGYGKNAQSKDVPCVNYADITSTYDGMIWIVDKNKVEINNYGGAQTCGGDWFNYDAATGQVTSVDGTVTFNVKDQKTYEAPSAPASPDEPTGQTTIIVGDKEYPVEVGDEVTYTFYLNLGGIVESLEAVVGYDADILEFIPVRSYDEDRERYIHDYAQMFPQLNEGGQVGINYFGYSDGDDEKSHITEPGTIRYNCAAGDMGAVFKKDDHILCQLKFKVIANGQAEINHCIETAGNKIGKDQEYYYIKNSQPLVDIYTLETLDVPEHPVEPDPDNPNPDNPDPDNPNPDNPDPDNPNPDNPDPDNPNPDNSAPTKPASTAPSATPGSATPDAGSTTGNGNSNAVKTGASEMAIVFFVILLMAAGVVVFTRKKVK